MRVSLHFTDPYDMVSHLSDVTYEGMAHKNEGVPLEYKVHVDKDIEIEGKSYNVVLLKPRYIGHSVDDLKAGDEIPINAHIGNNREIGLIGTILVL